MKTICFDLRALQIGHEHRGIGMYARSILEHLPKDGNKYLFYCFDKNNPIADLDITLRIDYEIVYTPTVKTALGSLKDLIHVYRLVHHQFTPLRRHSPDVFIQFDFTLGIPRWQRTKTIVIGYDLIPLIRKKEYLPGFAFAWYHSEKRLRGVARAIYYRLKYALHYTVYKHADTVLCISAASADSFHTLLHIDAQKLHSIPLAPVLSTAKPDNSKAGIIPGPYLLYVGGSDSRKRVCDIVYAYNIARGRGAHLALVFAGYDFRGAEQMMDPIGKRAIQESPYRENMYLLGFVSDAEKLGLYKQAQAFVFASTYEGFGLPIVEAMAAGCPVIAYDNSSIPEAAGEAALLVPTGDYVGIANQVLRLQDPGLRKQYAALGLRHARKFSWDTYVKQLKTIL